MMNPPSDTGFVPQEIVGSCQTPDAYSLPMRLTAIGKDSVGDFGIEASEGCWSCEPKAWMQELFDHQELHLFAEAIPYLPGHVLLQVIPDAPAEYIPLEILRTRLDQVHDTAMTKVETALREGRLQEAENETWLAARAQSKDPVARLLLIALVRPTVKKDLVRSLTRRLPTRDPAEWLKALGAVLKRWPVICERILADPLLVGPVEDGLE